MDSYAIVEVGGKQYRAQKGDSIVVDRLHADVGAKVSPKALLFRADKAVFDGAALGKVKVDAVIAEHLRGPKIHIFKYKPKQGYRRRAGHRSELTRIEIKDIRLAAPKPAAKKDSEAVAKPAAKRVARPKTKQTGTKKPSAGSKDGA